jgi:hypothetical protein
MGRRVFVSIFPVVERFEKSVDGLFFSFPLSLSLSPDTKKTREWEERGGRRRETNEEGSCARYRRQD